jgi:hypothetical protein
MSIAALLMALDFAYAQQGQSGQSSYMPVDIYGIVQIDQPTTERG